MTERRQLPPQIKRVELAHREGGRPVIRYQLPVDVGVVDRKRKRYATEKKRGRSSRLPGCAAARWPVCAGVTSTSTHTRFRSPLHGFGYTASVRQAPRRGHPEVTGRAPDTAHPRPPGRRTADRQGHPGGGSAGARRILRDERFCGGQRSRRSAQSARIDVLVGAHAQGSRRPPHSVPRRSAYVRDADASGGRAYRGDSAWLGHASKAFTMATYVHSQPAALSTAAQSFARVDNSG
jgi:hypothetical protein